MQTVFMVGDQPVPGYRLISDLGGSAFYKMWKVQAPDGSIKMWKQIDLVVGNAAIETRTLGLLVQLRHPYLNTLTNFWQLDNGETLIIESDVPVISLRDRLEQCKSVGQSIPIDEVQTYVAQAAEGLDFLNAPRHKFQGQQVAIYHRALRPECLLLFQDGANRICKVSDFGLAKPVTDQGSEHSQGLMHYDYDPPEFFEGQTAPASDQYALAINYYELRTGVLPFNGTMLEQLQARLNDSPNLQLLPEPERSAVRKALSRDPRARYENCTAFANQLRSAEVPAGMSAATTPAPRSGRPTPGSAPGSSGGFATVPAPPPAPPTGSPPPPGVVFHRPPPGSEAPARTEANPGVKTPPSARPVDRATPPSAAGAASPPAPAKPQEPSVDLKVLRQRLGGGGASEPAMDSSEGGSGKIPIWFAVVLIVIILAGAYFALSYFSPPAT